MKTKFITSVSLVVLIGAFAVLQASETYKPPPESIKPPRVTVDSVYREKCSRCHAVSRSDSAVKNPQQWKETVSRMRGKDASWITEGDAENIYSFLAGRQLWQNKCGKCHDASRAEVQKTPSQWQTTLDRMQSKDPAWISDSEKTFIKFYLSDVYLLELD